LFWRPRLVVHSGLSGLHRRAASPRGAAVATQLGWVLLRRITRAFESSHSQGPSTPSEFSVDKKGVASGTPQVGDNLWTNQSRLFGAAHRQKAPRVHGPWSSSRKAGRCSPGTDGACVVRRCAHEDSVLIDSALASSSQRGHGCATWGVRAESGLGRSSPPPWRRGGAVDTERCTSAPEPELLGQPLAARRSAARKSAKPGGNP
jgi:hypothetical protein